MAAFTINIPDDRAARVVDAFAANYGWTAQLGVSKARFAREKIREFILDNVRAYEAAQAAEAARAAAAAACDADLAGVTVT